MNMQEKNLEKIMQAVGNIEISADEKRYLEWLSKYDPDTVNNIVSVMTKIKSRGAGRKKSVDVERQYFNGSPELALIQICTDVGKHKKGY
jgi:hypothetical protein